MTDRERILAAVRGEPVDRIPWVPRMEFWYRARVRKGTMPAPLRGLTLNEVIDRLGLGYYAVVPDFTVRCDEFDMIDRALGIYNLPVFTYKATLQNVDRKILSRGKETVVEYHTPVGSIRTAALLTEEMLDGGASISYVTEHAVKAPKDFEVVGYIFENTKVTPQLDGYLAKRQEAGERGIVIAFTSGTACPMHHIMKDLMPVEQFFLAMHDHPALVERLAERIEPFFDAIQQCAADSPAEVVLLGGNYDDAITYPPFFRKYIMPPLQKYARQLHQRGKYLMTHTDGENKGLLDLYLETGFDVADSVCPAPMTRNTLAELYEAFANRITIWGGIPSVLLCADSATDADFRRFIDDVIERYGKKSRLILGVSDMVTAEAKWDRLQYISDKVKGIG